jgi:predicted deacetylase
MPLPNAASRAAAVAVHDMSPATWPECRELLAMLDDLGVPRVSLLVVPDFHGRAHVLDDAAFVRAMEARLARGDELVLHGYFHVDDAPPPRTPRAFFERRMLTRAEGEFAALECDAAATRIARGLAMFDRLGWPLAGFVPPAWLLGAGAREALSRYADRFAYVTVRRGLYRLPDWRFERTANLWYSPTSRARRAMSRCAIGLELRHARSQPLLRISLHPQDVRGAGVAAHWRRLIADAITTRRPVTKAEWARHFDAPAATPGVALHSGASRVGAQAARARAAS